MSHLRQESYNFQNTTSHFIALFRGYLALRIVARSLAFSKSLSQNDSVIVNNVKQYSKIVFQ